MKIWSMILYIISAVVVLIIVIAIVLNNQIIAKKNRIDQAFSSIDVYLKKRFDLVPNLIAIVNKYAKHEKEILLGVTELRTKIAEATQQNEKIEARYILTPVLMEKIVELREKYNRNIMLSFTKQQLFLTVENSAGLFSFPSKKIASIALIEELVSQIKITVNIVNDFNLNKTLTSQ